MGKDREVVKQLDFPTIASAEFSLPKVKSTLCQLAQGAQVSASELIRPIRLTLAGLAIGSGLLELIDVLG